MSSKISQSLTWLRLLALAVPDAHEDVHLQENLQEAGVEVLEELEHIRVSFHDGHIVFFVCR